jgi:hypothetical protein
MTSMTGVARVAGSAAEHAGASRNQWEGPGAETSSSGHGGDVVSYNTTTASRPAPLGEMKEGIL